LIEDSLAAKGALEDVVESLIGLKQFAHVAGKGLISAAASGASGRVVPFKDLAIGVKRDAGDRQCAEEFREARGGKRFNGDGNSCIDSVHNALLAMLKRETACAVCETRDAAVDEIDTLVGVLACEAPRMMGRRVHLLGMHGLPLFSRRTDKANDSGHD
jgi:hypothetical protein